jgi:hypothetical protein
MFYFFRVVINIASFVTPLSFSSSSSSSPSLSTSSPSVALTLAHSLDSLFYSLNMALLSNLVFCVEGPSNARINP